MFKQLKEIYNGKGIHKKKLYAQRMMSWCLIKELGYDLLVKTKKYYIQYKIWIIQHSWGIVHAGLTNFWMITMFILNMIKHRKTVLYTSNWTVHRKIHYFKVVFSTYTYNTKHFLIVNILISQCTIQKYTVYNKEIHSFYKNLSVCPCEGDCLLILLEIR